MMRVTYASKAASCHRYFCRSRDFRDPEQPCIAVGGVRIDRAVASQMLDALTPTAIEAAEVAARQVAERADDARAAVDRELEEARYEAKLAARRYEVVDPDKRLVARQLEALWEAALQRVSALEERLLVIEEERLAVAVPDLSQFRELARRLPEVWNAPTTDAKLKQRIVRILIKEVVVDVDDDNSEAVAVIHWIGGRHTELRVHRNRAPVRTMPILDAPDIVRKMAGRYTDGEIALTLNRTRRGWREPRATWSELRVRDIRQNLGLADCDASSPRAAMLTRDEVAHRLGICVGSVTRLIADKILPAEQVAPYAPWQIAESALRDEKVLAGVQAVVDRRPRSLSQYQAVKALSLPGID